MPVPVNSLADDWPVAPTGVPQNGLLTAPAAAEPVFQSTDNPLTALAPTLADAWQHNAGAYQDFVAKQRASGVADGTIDPDTGWPTQAGILDAARQYGGAMIAGTSGPGGRALATMENPAFAKWFGASKGVDAKGLPQTYYHGTNSDVGAFERVDGGNQYGDGYYFTTSPGSASDYATGNNVNRITPSGNAGPNVIPAHLSFDKPYMRREVLAPTDLKALETAANGVSPGTWKKGELAGMFDKAYPANGDNVAYQLGGNANEVIRKAGFDAMVDPNMTVVFNPTQIKSAIGNRGTFSPTDPRITYGVGGLAAVGAGAAADNPPPSQ